MYWALCKAVYMCQFHLISIGQWDRVLFQFHGKPRNEEITSLAHNAWPGSGRAGMGTTVGLAPQSPHTFCSPRTQWDDLSEGHVPAQRSTSQTKVVTVHWLESGHLDFLPLTLLGLKVFVFKGKLPINWMHHTSGTILSRNGDKGVVTEDSWSFSGKSLTPLSLSLSQRRMIRVECH